MNDDDLIVDIVSRAPVFEELREPPTTRRELELELDTSQTTVHRILTSLKERNLIRETDEGIVLTALGRTLAAEVERFEETVWTAIEIEPILAALGPTDFDIDVSTLTGERVTTADPENPYRPVERLLELLEETSTLQGMYRIVPNPMFADRLYELLMDYADVEVIYQRRALEEMAAQNPDWADAFANLEHVEVLVDEEVPVGLTITDERVAIAGYERESGVLGLLVDTDHPEMVDWAGSLYAACREDAEPFFADGR